MHKNIAHSWYSNPFSLGVGVGGLSTMLLMHTFMLPFLDWKIYSKKKKRIL